jgi:histidine ammonia-lyase
MATYASLRLHTMLDNVAYIVAIELLAAAQGIEFHHPKKSSGLLEQVISEIRQVSDHYAEDRSLSPDIERLAHLVDEGYFYGFASAMLPSGAE